MLAIFEKSLAAFCILLLTVLSFCFASINGHPERYIYGSRGLRRTERDVSAPSRNPKKDKKSYYKGGNKDEVNFLLTCKRRFHLESKGTVSQDDYARFLFNYCSTTDQPGESCMGQKGSFESLPVDVQLNFVRGQCPEDRVAKLECLDALIQGGHLFFYKRDIEELCVSTLDLLVPGGLLTIHNGLDNDSKGGRLPPPSNDGKAYYTLPPTRLPSPYQWPSSFPQPSSFQLPSSFPSQSSDTFPSFIPNTPQDPAPSIDFIPSSAPSTAMSDHGSTPNSVGSLSPTSRITISPSSTDDLSENANSLPVSNTFSTKSNQGLKSVGLIPKALVIMALASVFLLLLILFVARHRKEHSRKLHKPYNDSALDGDESILSASWSPLSHSQLQTSFPNRLLTKWSFRKAFFRNKEQTSKQCDAFVSEQPLRSSSHSRSIFSVKATDRPTPLYQGTQQSIPSRIELVSPLENHSCGRQSFVMNSDENISTLLGSGGHSFLMDNSELHADSLDDERDEGLTPEKQDFPLTSMDDIAAKFVLACPGECFMNDERQSIQSFVGKTAAATQAENPSMFAMTVTKTETEYSVIARAGSDFSPRRFWRNAERKTFLTIFGETLVPRKNDNRISPGQKPSPPLDDFSLTNSTGSDPFVNPEIRRQFKEFDRRISEGFAGLQADMEAQPCHEGAIGSCENQTELGGRRSNSSESLTSNYGDEDESLFSADRVDT